MYQAQGRVWDPGSLAPPCSAYSSTQPLDFLEHFLATLD